MKKPNYANCALVIAILVSASILSCQSGPTMSPSNTTSVATNMNGGQLTIFRAANLGEDLLITVDGKQPSTTVREGDTFSRSLSPGPHTVSIILLPNHLHLGPTIMHMTVEKGKTYAYTAMWRGETLILRQ